MQKFSVNSGEAKNLHRQIFKVEDDAWDMLVEGEEHDVSEGYDLTRPDNRYSMYAKLRMLNGLDYKAKLGADVTLDKVQITRWHPDTCNCVTTYLWRSDHNEDEREHHPHRGEKHCGSHAHLKGDCHAHGHELWAENRHKNITVSEIAEHLGVPVHEVEWEHKRVGGERVLHVVHANLADPHAHGHAQLRISNHPVASQRAVSLSPR